MFKIFNRQKSRRKNSFEREDVNNDTNKRHSLRSSSSFCDEIFLEELKQEEQEAKSHGCDLSLCGGFTNADEGCIKYNSRLSMSLSSIINDQNCLSYFVQYLETKNALSLIKFYLDTENFKAAAIAQLEKAEQPMRPSIIEEEVKVEQQKQEKVISHQRGKSELVGENGDKQSDDGDDEVDSNVPELKTLCDISMHKPLTDDEKSRIYAETNKQINKCHGHKTRAGSDLSLYSEDYAVCSSENGFKINAASIKDAMAIYQKYLIANAKQFFYLPVNILSNISLLLCKCDDDFDETDTDSSVAISYDCFDEAQQYVLDLLEQNYLNDFLQSAFYINYCIELIEGSSSNNETEPLTIYDILHSEVTLFFFMEFLEQHDERSCLDFWTAAINFRKSYTDDMQVNETRVPFPKIPQESEAQADAMIIYEKFFSLQSDTRLWMSDKLRSHVEECICAAGQVAYCFDLPLQVVAKYLDRKYFAAFLKSQLIENYLNELKTRIHEENSIGSLSNHNQNLTTTGIADLHKQQRHKLCLLRKSKVGRHRKTLSDCTNESTRDIFKHISQQNTLLAMDTKHLHTTGSNLNIDARQLTNPNLLWHRTTSTAGGLKFGRVNALGRYERDFDDVDAATQNYTGKHNWSFSISGNKLKNAMRKLVNLPEEKVQEEIAWQVAEMIIKDVTSVTLNSGKTGTVKPE